MGLKSNNFEVGRWTGMPNYLRLPYMSLESHGTHGPYWSGTVVAKVWSDLKKGGGRCAVQADLLEEVRNYLESIFVAWLITTTVLPLFALQRAR